jgi:hypothetical protein
LGTRQKITPYGYKVLLVGEDLQILPQNATFIPGNTVIQSIASVLISEIQDNFNFYTQDICKDIEIGQVVEFDGVIGYPTVTAVTAVGSGVGSKTQITLSIAQDFTPLSVGTQVTFNSNPNTNTNKYWTALLNVYGTVRPGVSLITLDNPNLPTEIVGTINFNPDDDRLLKFTIDPDTLPSNTLVPVDSVIDPEIKYPNTPTDMNGELPIASMGQRYLIVNSIGTQQTQQFEITNTTDSPVGTTVFTSPSGPIDEFNLNSYVGQSVAGLFRGTPFFPTGTTITSVLYNNTTNIITVVVSNGSLQVLPADQYVTLTTRLQTTNRAWGALVANANDIIEYNGTQWFVSYDSAVAQQQKEIDFVTNLNTGIQYRWGEGSWSKSYEGFYAAGDWSIVI